MNLKPLLFFLNICLLAGCASKKGLSEAPAMVGQETNSALQSPNQYKDNETVFTNVKLTSQETFPGVQSNLRSTINYKLTFSAEVSSKIEFTRLMVDTVSLPFHSLFINGERLENKELVLSSEVVSLTGYRKVFSKDLTSPQVMEPVTYNLSGLSLDKKAVIEYMKNDKPYYYEIDTIQKLSTIYAP